jgi:hypothetical protein
LLRHAKAVSLPFAFIEVKEFEETPGIPNIKVEGLKVCSLAQRNS